MDPTDSRFLGLATNRQNELATVLDRCSRSRDDATQGDCGDKDQAKAAR
jgi:hypothetical protein